MTQPVFVPGDGNSLSQTFGTSGVRSAQYSSISGWDRNKLYSDLDFVFMVEADERVASLFLLWGFTSTSGNDLLVP